MYNSINEIVNELENVPVEASGSIYHPIPFKEFDHLITSTNKDEFLKKWEIINRSILNLAHGNMATLNILDIGANAGFFTFKLGREVKNVTSFEPHPRYGLIGKKIIQFKNINNIKWYNENLNFEKIENKYFDVTLMLSVFQWMADGGTKLKEALEILLNISRRSKYLIFELGFNSGKSCLKTDNPDHYEELLSLLKTNTIYTNFELLGQSNFWEGSNRYIILCY